MQVVEETKENQGWRSLNNLSNQLFRLLIDTKKCWSSHRKVEHSHDRPSKKAIYTVLEKYLLNESWSWGSLSLESHFSCFYHIKRRRQQTSCATCNWSIKRVVKGWYLNNFNVFKVFSRMVVYGFHFQKFVKRKLNCREGDIAQNKWAEACVEASSDPLVCVYWLNSLPCCLKSSDLHILLYHLKGAPHQGLAYLGAARCQYMLSMYVAA